MKISPVAGTPTIPQTPNTGIAPERMAKAKAAFNGGVNTQVSTQEPTQEEKEKLLAATQSNKITMQTNKTPEVQGTEIGNGEIAETVPESSVSDAIVQASEVPEATEPISPQLAALARQRRALQVREKELADKEKALGGNTRADLEARIKSSPLSVLQELGVTYDKLTQDILSSQGQINPEIETLKAEIKALKEGTDKKFSESQVAQESSAINYVADKLDVLMASGDDFELLKLAEGEEEVIRRVYNHWKKTGKELNVSEEAKKYQEELAEEAARYAKVKMVQGKLTPTEPAQATPQPPQTGMRTLTNKDSARPTMDRRQRAILAMQGQLKR